MAEFVKYSAFDLDMLKECINIGIGNAVNALSELLKRKVEIVIPDISEISVLQFCSEFKRANQNHFGIFLPISGDLFGQSILLLEEDSARKMISKLYDFQDYSLVKFDDMGISALSETSNIIIGAYLTAISNFLDLNIVPRLPVVKQDNVSQILEYGIKDFNPKMESVFVAKENLIIEDEEIQGTVLLFFSNDSNEKIISQLHQRYKV